MRCAVLIGVCLTVIALSEARSFGFGSKNLQAGFAARFLQNGAPHSKAQHLSRISAKRSHEGQSEGDLIGSAEDLVYGVGQFLNATVWNNVPEEAWGKTDWCQYRGKQWFDDINTQAAIGAIAYVTWFARRSRVHSADNSFHVTTNPSLTLIDMSGLRLNDAVSRGPYSNMSFIYHPEIRPLIDVVYTIFGENFQCLEMAGMGKALREKHGSNSEYKFVEKAIDIVSSQCERRADDTKELLKYLEDVECMSEEEREVSFSQKQLFRKRRGDEETEEDEETRVDISRHMFKALKRAGECLLGKSEEHCDEAIGGVEKYINGLTVIHEADEEVGNKVKEIMCAELNEAVQDLAAANEINPRLETLLDYIDFQTNFENLVSENCDPPPADQPGRSLDILKELLRGLQTKK